MKEESPAGKSVAPTHAGAKTQGKIAEKEFKSARGLVGVTAAWTVVGIPLAFGLWNTVQQAVALFR
jgi:hypothetical protein